MKRKLRAACIRQLQVTFGLKAFRPGQQAAANALLTGRDLLCILPTGAGKSLCWQLPAVMRRELTVVVSPLIALMRDQVIKLTELGIDAVCIDSIMTVQERQEALKRVRMAAVRIVYVSPERMEQPSFQEILRSNPPWLVVVDEAHCVVQWGDEFRPAYQRLGEMIDMLPKRPVICAMTATADKTMQKSLCRNLKMRRKRRIELPIIRENLTYTVCTTLSKRSELGRLVSETDGRVVIFCRTRSRTEYLAQLLCREGHSAACYHAGLDRTQRNEAQEMFLDGSIRILAATSAFGMGIDIPDIRLVIHDSLPDSVTEYLQQTGRAGRDGQESTCVALIEPNDFLRYTDLARRIRHQNRAHPFRRCQLLRKLRRGTGRLLRVCLASDCIYQAAASEMGQRTEPCGKCSACLHGRQVLRVPDMTKMNARETREWILHWQRRRLSEMLQVPAGTLMTELQLTYAAECKPLINPEKPVHERMQRLVDYFFRRQE